MMYLSNANIFWTEFLLEKRGISEVDKLREKGTWVTQELQLANRSLYTIQQKLGSQNVQDKDAMEAYYAPKLEISVSLNLLRVLPRTKNTVAFLM